MNIKNGDLPAMPIYLTETMVAAMENGAGAAVDRISGLTKREQFAMAAMQGMLANGSGYNHDADLLAQYAISNADALLAELERTK